MRAFFKLVRRSFITFLSFMAFVLIFSVAALMWGLSIRLVPRNANVDNANSEDQQTIAFDDSPEIKGKSLKLPQETMVVASDHGTILEGDINVKFANDKHEEGNVDSLKETKENKVETSSGNYFIPPTGETPVRRFPQAVIIGFGKCGTRAMLTFLSLHPYIVIHPQEIHFYSDDNLFAKGYKWYLSIMPLSYSNQVTMEKSPDYVCSTRARKEIADNFPDIKLIVLVRNPVDRLVSQYLQKYRYVESSKRPDIKYMYRNRTTNQFNPNTTAVDVGIYHKHLSPWLRTFPRENILVVADEVLTSDPLGTLKKAEAFLKIPAILNEENFYYNETSGFYCSKRFTSREPRCMNINKGWKHPDLPKDDEKMLYDFYRPHNAKLFKLVNETFPWIKM